MDTKVANKLRKMASLIIVVCIATIFALSFSDIFAKLHDAKRKGDIRELVQALDIFYDRFGEYPEGKDDWQGWDTTYNPDGEDFEFIPILSKSGILIKKTIDPINSRNYFYRYRKFPAGEYGCNRSFYILQITNFETVQKSKGRGNCPEIDFVSEAPNGYTVMGVD